LIGTFHRESDSCLKKRHRPTVSDNGGLCCFSSSLSCYPARVPPVT
jgi:uncharacterized protein (DUF779 family)